MGWLLGEEIRARSIGPVVNRLAQRTGASWCEVGARLELLGMYRRGLAGERARERR